MSVTCIASAASQARKKLHRRAGGGDQRHALARMAEAPGVDRHRLGPAEHERDPADGQQLADQQDAGQEDGADPVDVPQRVERQPPGQLRRVVAERQRRVAVRRLVQGDRQHGGDHRQRCRRCARSCEQPSRSASRADGSSAWRDRRPGTRAAQAAKRRLRRIRDRRRAPPRLGQHAGAVQRQVAASRQLPRRPGSPAARSARASSGRR